MSVYSNRADSSPDEIKGYVSAILELLGDRNPIDVLASTEAALRSAVASLSDRQISQPESPGKWSVRQVLAHLADSELVGSWRFRLVLAQDRPTLTGYDQDLWADRLHYADSPVQDSLDRFGVLRSANVQLFKRASPDDLARVGVHSERGEESLGHLMRLYAGHDLLHLRQIDRITRTIG